MATILCVEDYFPNAMLIKDILECTGAYTVQVAEDGIVGYEMAMTNQFDLLLIDMQMPRMDGYTLIKELLASSSFRKVPIVMMTAYYGQPGDRFSYLGLPHTSKPINTREIPKLIEKLLNEATQEPPDAPE